MSITIINEGITEIDADCIVNAANEDLLASGGVCDAVFNAAGKMQLQQACDEIGHCDTGKAVIMSGFNTKAKYIIHAVGPQWIDGHHHEPQLLYSCYREALRLAQANQIHRIVFPLISAGIFGYPKDQAWKKAFQACLDYENNHPEANLEIRFSVLNEADREQGEEILSRCIDVK